MSVYSTNDIKRYFSLITICNLYFHWMFLELYDTCNIDIIAFVNVTSSMYKVRTSLSYCMSYYGLVCHVIGNSNQFGICLCFHYLAPHRGRARYCNAHVCLSVCLFVCVFVRVFAKFQCVISQPFLNRSLWNLAYLLRMGTPWLTNIFRILGQRSRS